MARWGRPRRCVVCDYEVFDFLMTTGHVGSVFVRQYPAQEVPVDLRMAFRRRERALEPLTLVDERYHPDMVYMAHACPENREPGRALAQED